MLYEDMTEREVLKSIMTMEVNQRPLDVEMMVSLKNLYNNTSSPLRNPSTSERIYNGRQEAWTPVNYTAMLVDKISSVLYGRNVSRETGSEELDKTLVDVYRRNKSAFLRISKVASLCGYGAIRLRRKWDGTITFDTYGFADVTPILDPVDPYGSPQGLFFSSLVDKLPAWAASQVRKKKAVYNFCELITRNIRDDSGKITSLGEYKAYVDDKEVTTPSNGINPMGDYLGAVYWRGLDHPFNPWGKSDMLPLYETLVAINEMFTDGRELMTWGIHSPIVVTGQVEGQLNWQYSPRSIFEAPGEGVNVKRLESATQSFRDFKEFVEMLLQQFHQTSRVPSVAVGDLNGIGKASSGRAFEIAMIPLAELIDEKETLCVPQEIELMREILAKKAYYGDISGFTSLIQGYTMPDVIKINKATEGANIEFAPITFPEVATAETLTSQVKGGIRSQENAIKTLHEDWNQTQVDEEMAKIASEATVETDKLAGETISALKSKLENK